MLSTGELKMVQHITLEDKLMGDDSTPRKVLSLARGREMMYDVIPKKDAKILETDISLIINTSTPINKKAK